MANSKKVGSKVKNVLFYLFLIFVASVITAMHLNGANPWRIFVE